MYLDYGREPNWYQVGYQQGQLLSDVPHLTYPEISDHAHVQARPLRPLFADQWAEDDFISGYIDGALSQV